MNNQRISELRDQGLQTSVQCGINVSKLGDLNKASESQLRKLVIQIGVTIRKIGDAADIVVK